MHSSRIRPLVTIQGGGGVSVCEGGFPDRDPSPPWKRSPGQRPLDIDPWTETLPGQRPHR